MVTTLTVSTLPRNGLDRKGPNFQVLNDSAFNGLQETIYRSYKFFNLQSPSLERRSKDKIGNNK